MAFPKTYELDDCYCSLIFRFIRYEFLSNADRYVDKSGLKQFVKDLEKFHWHATPETSISFLHYCGSVTTHPEFVLCLSRIRELLDSFGEEFPPEWKERLKVTPEDSNSVIRLPVKRAIYWLDCLSAAVNEYKPNIGVTTFPLPPE